MKRGRHEALRRMSRGWALPLALVFSLVMGSVAMADNLIVDGDGFSPVDPSALNLGSVCIGQQKVGTALLAINRVGGGNVNVYANSSAVVVSAGTPSSTSVSQVLGDYDINLPGDWTSQDPNTRSSDTASATVTVTGQGPVGGKTASIGYTATGVNLNNASLTRSTPLTINWTVVQCDTTPPVIVSDVVGTLGDNGWYVGDVTVTWSVTDAESLISTSSGCDLTTIVADTAGTTLTCSATSAGGTNSASVTVKRDTVTPSISGSAAPAANSNGWNNTDVTVSFTCSDTLSGIATCPTTATISGEGTGQSATGTATDNAGNTASATVNGINIDKTAPVVSVTGVSNGATYLLGSAPSAGCSTTDALSGVDIPATLAITGGPLVGTFSAACTGATDNAGNIGSATATYTVVYDFAGFFRPVDMAPMINVAKAGSAIPVKFSLGGNQGPSVMAAGYPRSVPVSCTGGSQEAILEAETVTAGSSSLSYDALSDQYTYVWKTEKAWSGCRRLDVKLVDGQTYSALFKFSK